MKKKEWRGCTAFCRGDDRWGYGEARMASRSGSSGKGVRYAIVIGIALVLVFQAGEWMSHWKRPGYYRAPRTTTLSVRAQPGKAIRISEEPLPVIAETPLELFDRSTWVAYRSEAPSRLDRIAPPAGARLTAPVSIALTDPMLESVPVRSAIRPERSPLQDSIDASTVSRATPVVVRIRGGDKSKDPWDRNWPAPRQLEGEIAMLRGTPLGLSDAETGSWLAAIARSFDELQRHPIGSSSGAPLLESIDDLVTQGYALSEKHTDDLESSRILSRLAYAIERRCAVWTSVHQCVNKSDSFSAPREYSIDSRRMQEQLDIARQSLQATEDSVGWHAYLMLDRVEDLAEGRIVSDQEQIATARRFLHRVTNTRVKPDQLRVLRSEPIHRLADLVHPLTIKPVDYRKLLSDLETLEAAPVHRCAGDVADAIESLRFSEHPEVGAIASAINTHYRNANVRLSVSESFLNRMMPKGQITTRPVQQRILGADTRGASQVHSNLKVDVLPDASAWHIRLRLDGEISSSTQSSRNGVTFFNSGTANVQTDRELRVDGQSLSINGSSARVDSSDSLRRFSTEWDSMPIVGDMIRYVAHREFSQSRPIAKRITQRLIAKQTDEEFDKQLRSQIGTAQERLESRFLGPLQSLQLSPLVMDMESTEDRLVARYRFANESQLSAYTPRPLAPGDSQLSFQIHQSIFNNLIDRAIDANREWTIQELSDSIADVLQQPRPALPSDTPHDVTIHFASPNPMSVEFGDGKMWLTLRIETLEQPGRIHLKNFEIRTSYTADVDGLQAELVRDGVVSIDGHRLGSRDRLPLRAIFNKVFSARTNIPMVAQSLLEDPRAAGLMVSQFVMRDGWLGIAISEREPPQVAGPRPLNRSLR
jgi:hypothetical protein